MPFARPTLAALITRIQGDLRGRLQINGPILRRAMVDVLGAVWAGAVHTLYGFMDFLSLQLSAATSERETLLATAALYGITPTAATFAAGNVAVTGTNGTVIPTGKILRLDALTAYTVTTGATIASGTATIGVTAVLAGAAGNLPATTGLTFETPFAGVNAAAVVATGGITGGIDQEGTEEVRARYVLRLQEPPEGGANQDYIAWALAVPGVTRAWVFPLENGLGTVAVRFVLDGAVSIFPLSGDVAAVQAALTAQRPITAVVTAVAPTALSVAFTIHISPDTADLRAAVAAELADLLLRVARPGDGVGAGTVLLSQIRTAIGIGVGGGDYLVTVPSADVVPALGQLPVIGTITWV